MRLPRPVLLAAAAGMVACSGNQPKGTLATLHDVAADTQDVQVEGGLDTAVESYRRFLEQTPEGELTAEATRRLADLKIEKEYGIRGDGGLLELPAPQVSMPAKPQAPPGARAARPAPGPSEQELEKRATQQPRIASAEDMIEAQLPDGLQDDLARAGPLEAIELYDRVLAKYPSHEHNDMVLYQKARAFDELGRTEEAMKVMQQLVAAYPNSHYLDEVLFRRAEHFFTRRKFREAESAYAAIIAMGPGSEYYELSLYKLGWSLYKQEFYDEALHKYTALLDYKVSVGYDFDEKHEEGDERRVQDTFEVISLSFSNIGGPEVVQEYFATYGHRDYEDRVYRNLGEFHFGKLRYNDAAKVYNAFITLYPFHRVAPHFGMRVIEIYGAGGFPKLVLESKKEFATKYAPTAEYWQHFALADAPEVLSYLKGNLKDLANHYHAQYQDKGQAQDRLANYAQASHWYTQFLQSFGNDPEAPPINYQLADLMLEHHDYAGAARQYERTAYEYPAHGQAAAAGYAAIFAHREHLKVAGDQGFETARRDTVASSLKFADTFPDHEHAAVVLGAAADDLYAMKDYAAAVSSARKLIERYPDASAAVRRSAWIVAAHSSLELGNYPEAEQAYARVLDLTPKEDASRPGLVENLAASIYKQGEQANQLGDYRAAANHFLRVKQAAPTSTIRANAEYDAGAALIRLEDWTAAAQVLDAFRSSYPDHELQRESTKQIAFVYQQDGQLARAAQEYERIAAESDDPKLRAEALLLAGQLYEQSADVQHALAVYGHYVEQFPRPIEAAVETRFKIAGIYQQRREQDRYLKELQEIVRIDAAAGGERSGRTRHLAAQSALVLAQQLYDSFAELKLLLPFEQSLQTKQQRMNAAMAAFGQLVDYEVGEVTAAATYYMAEIYSNFSRALTQSQRPTDLDAAAMQDYELALEEEAFPFEEKAITFHAKNLELIRTGIYNAWIDKSLGRLAQLSPGRYAKSEISTGFLGALDRYAYRTPASIQPPAGTGTAPSPAQPASPPQDVQPAASAIGEVPDDAAASEGVAHAILR
jgi:tetratricopeptide (TPR) repeat protein